MGTLNLPTGFEAAYAAREVSFQRKDSPSAWVAGGLWSHGSADQWEWGTCPCLLCALGQILVEGRVIPELSEKRTAGDTPSREDSHSYGGIRT